MRQVEAWGLCYIGSKNKFVRSICEHLPKRKRLVELFAGGGAVSDYALTKGIFSNVLLRDINSNILTLFKETVSGKEIDFHFTPREEFYKSEDFVKRLCWSFASDQRTYFTSVERLKTYMPLIDYVINCADFHNLDKSGDCLDRYQRWLDSGINPRPWLRPFDNQKRLIKMARRHQNKLFNYSISYEVGEYSSYIPQDGDVVFCDPPYMGTDVSQYGLKKWTQEDYDNFCKWAQKLDAPVFLTEWHAPCVNHRVVYKKARQNLMGDNHSTKTEYLFEILR